MPNYIYKLTAEQLRASTNQAMKTYYEQEDNDKEKPSNYREGLSVAQKDTNRKVQINGRFILEKGSAEQYAEMIKKELNINPEQISTAYSQSIMAFIVHPMNRHPDIGLSSENNRLFEGSGRVDNLYQEDGEVYFKTKVAGYDITTPENFYMEGPVELLYKLKNGQFELQHMETQSAFIHDAFLGKPISQERLVQEQEKSIKMLRALHAIEHKLKKPEGKASNSKIQDIFAIAIQAVKLCKEKKITARELGKTLENLLPVIAEFEKTRSGFSRFFWPRSEIILKQVITGYVKLVNEVYNDPKLKVKKENDIVKQQQSLK